MDKAKIKKFIVITIVMFLLVEFNFLKKIFPDNGETWIDTSHWEIQNSIIESGYWMPVTNKKWVDASYIVRSGFWSDESYQVWVDTSHWQNSGYWTTENYSTWVNSGYYAVMAYSEFVRSGYYASTWINSGYWGSIAYNVWVSSGFMREEKYGYWKIVEEYGWSINREYPVIGSAGHAQWMTYSIYRWIDTSHWETRYYAKWIDTSHWETRYYDTSHWEQKQRTYFVDTSHWETKQKPVWRDLSTYVTEGHWETREGSHWVDTSYTVMQGYWEDYTTYTWVDTSYNETRKVWVISGYYAVPMHGEVTVEKSPKYVFTRWHKDSNGKEAGMSLKINWKVDNSFTGEGEIKRKISRIYIYEDVLRYNEKGIEKVTIFDGSVPPAEEGSIDVEARFDYAGTEESLIHIYLYADTGETGHVSFANPVNGFRSINISQDGTSTNPDSWLGGIVNETFKF